MQRVLIKQLQRSPLADRRLLVLLLIQKGHGRRAFTEGCRSSKLPSLNRNERYQNQEIPTVFQHT